MKDILPLFPLNIVAFPGEKVNLHVFEPRYKQLISDCRHEGISFGIPTYLDETIEYGTEVELTSIKKAYSGGRMDVSTRGKRVFRILDYENPTPGKLYAGGQIQWMDNDTNFNSALNLRMRELILELFGLFDVDVQNQIGDDVNSYDVAHKIGLSLKQKYLLLKINSENKRLEFIIKHLENSIPFLRQMEESKERIKANGHFKHFDPLNF
jgi:hypothetical protein